MSTTVWSKSLSQVNNDLGARSRREHVLNLPVPQQGVCFVHNFRLQSSEMMPDMRLYYIALGESTQEASGRTTTAVLILHGACGWKGNFLIRGFAGVLFGSG